MADDVLAPQGSRASVTVALNQFAQNIAAPSAGLGATNAILG